MKILITGGTGLIGRALCTALLAAGHQLTVLSRKPDSVQAKCGASVQAMRSLSDWHPEMAFDAVINLAGEPIIDKPWSESRKKALLASRVDLTEQLVTCIAKAQYKPKVLLSGSAVGFYGDGGDCLLDESAGNADDFGSRLCTAWEQAAMPAINNGVRVCLLRTGLVLAPAGGLLAKMGLQFKLGLGSRIGDGKQWMSWIHIEDYVALVLMLLNHEDASGSFNMTAPKPVRNAEFTQIFAKVLHRPAIFATPSWLMKLVLGERAYLLLGGQRALPIKAQNLGYQFIHEDLESALHSLLA